MTAIESARAYNISTEDADMLKGLVGMPSEFRVMALEKYVASHGRYGLVVLFAEFMGLAASVEHNTRECVELYAITDATKT